jgi:8-oxo-dGTP diphosphatase
VSAHPHPASPPPAGYCPQCATPLESRHQEDRERPTCPSCGYIHYLDPKVAVAVVVSNDRGVLLGRRNIEPARGAWSFPAGYVNRGEVLEEAAMREVEEEMQVPVRLTGLVGVYSAHGEPVVLVVYAGTVESGVPRPDGDEVSEVRAFPPDALPEMAFTHDRRIVDDWRRLCRSR